MTHDSDLRKTEMLAQETISEARHGDMLAFERLYYRYRSQVYALCFRITKNRPDSEDLTQEVFLQVYRKVGGFRGDAAFGTWLYRVARNIVMMHLRRRRTDINPLNLAEGEKDLIETALPAHVHDCCEPLGQVALKRAISDLPKARRTVVILHDINGLTHREVGLRLGIEVGTSKSQLCQAHRKLRELLGGARTYKNDITKSLNLREYAGG
jgi:RNA polymerase sigma-70 factor, ECF subfamily